MRVYDGDSYGGGQGSGDGKPEGPTPG